jgi:Zn-dependent protease with chaperone function
MPLLLMVFLILVCLPELSLWPEPLWPATPLTSVAATWLTVVVMAGWALWLSRRTLRRLDDDPPGRDRALLRYDRHRFLYQLGLFAAYLVCLLLLGWGWALTHLWSRANGLLPGAELLLLTPFIASQMLAWAFFYDVERAADRLATPRLPRGEFSSSVWIDLDRPRQSFGSRAGFVLFQARQKLALVFLPVVLLLIHKELRRSFPEAWDQWQGTVNIVGGVLMATVFLTMPWVVRLMLGLRPLPPGPLRDRLQAAARRLRFRCSNILVWNTRSGMANAMVLGLVPWIRYVVFTDRLLEDFSADEVEAVFGHEVGHIRHHHMLFYFGFLTASIALLALLANVCTGLIQSEWPLDEAGSVPGRWHEYLLGLLDFKERQDLAVFPMVAVLLSYIFVVFGFLSRRCERQADIFGCRAVSCASRTCQFHDGEVELAALGKGLCPTGIRTFIRALEKVALVNGISRDRPGFLQSWQHSTIARRVEFLQRILIDPSLEPRFQLRVALVKWGIIAVLGAAILFLGKTWGWDF